MYANTDETLFKVTLRLGANCDVVTGVFHPEATTISKSVLFIPSNTDAPLLSSCVDTVFTKIYSPLLTIVLSGIDRFTVSTLLNHRLEHLIGASITFLGINQPLWSIVPITILNAFLITGSSPSCITAVDKDTRMLSSITCFFTPKYFSP